MLLRVRARKNIVDYEEYRTPNISCASREEMTNYEKVKSERDNSFAFLFRILQGLSIITKCMPSTYFILYEISLFLQLAACLPHAWKHGKANLVRLFAGILFGVLLELATIRQLNAYEYGQSR